MYPHANSEHSRSLPTDEAHHGGLLAHVQHILASNRYLVLATATPGGSPWATPVYFAHDEPTTFWWVSRPESRHSRTIAANPAVAITVFDSSVPIGGASAVYAEAWAQESRSDLVPAAIEFFSQCCQRDGGTTWNAERVTGNSSFRLYRARASSLFLLSTDGGPDRRISVPLPIRTTHESATHHTQET